MKSQYTPILKTLFKAAALALAFAPAARADTPLSFNGDATNGQNTALKEAIALYAEAPTDANYADLLLAGAVARDASALPTVLLSDGGNVTTRYEIAESAAGAVHLTSGVLSLSNSNDYETGGVFHFTYDSLGVFTAAADASYLFTGSNASVFFGGAIHNEGGTVALSNAVFTSNTAQDLGGAIANSGVFTLTNATFAGNIAANGSGGAIFNERGTLAISHATFTESKAYGEYGGGGAIYNEGGTLEISHATFTGNEANGEYGEGGAIYNEGGTLEISNADFIGNATPSGSFGGAISSRSGTLTITDSNFIQNASLNGGAIFSANGELNLNVTAGNTSTFSGNADISIFASDADVGVGVLIAAGNLNVSTATGAVLDLRDSVRGIQTNVTKSGAGTWKLGGLNTFPFLSSATFAVNEGTLYLYRAGEVANASPTQPGATVSAGKIESDGSFTLGGTATLVASGGNSISTKAGITLADGATLAFDVAHATADGDAILTLNGGSGGVSIGAIKVDLLTLNSTGGTYTLVTGGNFSGISISTFTLRGENVADTRAAASLSATGDGNSLKLVQSGTVANANIKWTGSSNIWNIASENWTPAGGGPVISQFLHGDSVTFDDSAAGAQKDLTVNAGGVEVGEVTINTNETYTFSGGEIIANTLTKSGEGKLVLNGPNTYASGAAISNGTVLVNGLLNGNVTVYAGTLGGSGGKINGIVNVGPGGTLSPGASVGVLEVTENVYLAPGATLFFELDASSSIVAFDVLRLLGDATELSVDAGTLLVVGVSGGGDIFGTYQVVEGGTVSEELTYLAAGHSFVLGTDGVLTVTSIPEPGTYALFGAIGAVALAFVRRRKTRRQ